MLAAPLLNIEAAFGATALTVPTQTTDPVSYGGSTPNEITSSGATGGEYVTLDATGLPAGATFDDSLDGCVLEDGSGNASFPNATVNVGTAAPGTHSFTVTATEWSDSSCSGTPVSTSSGPVTLDVAVSDQTITVPAPPSGPWNASLSVATTASSGLSVTNSIDALDSSANGCGVDASGNVSATGQVTFVVVISGHSGDMVPTGTVTFQCGANVLCTTSNFVRTRAHRGRLLHAVQLPASSRHVLGHGDDNGPGHGNGDNHGDHGGGFDGFGAGRGSSGIGHEFGR